MKVHSFRTGRHNGGTVGTLLLIATERKAHVLTQNERESNKKVFMVYNLRREDFETEEEFEDLDESEDIDADEEE